MSTHSLRIEPLGCTVTAPADQTLLMAALQGGVELRSACRNGTCRECICRLLEGAVHYRIEWPGLSPDEKLEGFVLPCVAYPAADVVLESSSGRRRS